MSDNDRLLQVMGRHPFTNSFSAEEEARLASICEEVEFKAGDRLLKEDDPCDRFFLLISGLVSVELRVHGGDLLRVQTEGPGTVLGWSWLFPPYRCSFDLKALEASRAIAIDAAAMRKMMEDDPAFGFRAMKELMSTVICRLSRSRLQLVDIYAKRGGAS